MKLSVFTTASLNNINDNETLANSMKCYYDLADEVVVVLGAGKIYPEKGNSDKIKVVEYAWPKEFDWPFIGQQFQRGYEAATGDWVIHADLDFIFHEKDFEAMRKACGQNPDAPALSLWKYQFILPDRYNLKSRLVIAVNKGKFGHRIKFNSGGDLCQPSLDSEEISPDSVPEARVAFYNYEKLTKTRAQIVDDVNRMDRAYKQHFGTWLYSKEGQTAYQGWLNMSLGRFHKPSRHIKLYEHPRYIQDTIRNLTPEQFGFNAFGELEGNDYVS